jgi:orotate phosphoribosyltransferase
MATQPDQRPDLAGAAPPPGVDWGREELRLLLASRSLKRGRFTLASGKVSPIYFNMKTTMMHPRGAALCARGLLAVLADIEVDYIAGLEMGAVPLLSVVSAFTAGGDRPVPSFFVRKTPKQHGTQAKIDGLDDVGGETLVSRRVVLIDDVATSGGSIVQAVDEIEKAGGVVKHAIVILDREEGATERLAPRGIALHSLFTARDLGVTDADRAPRE